MQNKVSPVKRNKVKYLGKKKCASIFKGRGARDLGKIEQEDKFSQQEYVKCLQNALEDSCKENESLKNKLEDLKRENIDIVNLIKERISAIEELAAFYEYCTHYHKKIRKRQIGKNLIK